MRFAMFRPRRLHRGAITVVLLHAIAATWLHAATPPTPQKLRRPKTEIEWQVAEITRDIAEMVVVAKTGAAPGPGFSVDIVDGPPGATLSMIVTLAAGTPAIVDLVSCP